MTTISAPLAVGLRVSAWLSFALAVALGGSPPLRAPPLPLPAALVVGGLAGAALYVTLADGSLPRSCRRSLSRLTVRGVYVGARAAYEEALWRGTFLARLATAVGAAPACALSTVGFALSHARLQGRRSVVHLLTGSAFASVYLATGRLGAAIAAHATYNVLVGAALDRGTAAVREQPPPAAEANGVEKRFGAREALRGVSLHVERGELVALVGANGAGKTTLLSILVGLRRPDRGSVRVCGGDPRQPRTRLALGVTPQDAAFPPTLRVGEVVDLVGAHFSAPLPSAEVLERFSLGELSARQTGGLSVGERRRLAVALAFVGRPRVVFLDEPTAGLDVEARGAVRRELQRFVGAGGSALLTSHDLHEIELIASRVAVLSRGRIVAAGPVAELRARAGLTRVRFETPRLPVLPGVRECVTDGARHSLLTSEPERLVAALVASGAPFSRLEVSPLGLEDAFADLLRGEPGP